MSNVIAKLKKDGHEVEISHMSLQILRHMQETNPEATVCVDFLPHRNRAHSKAIKARDLDFTGASEVKR